MHDRHHQLLPSSIKLARFSFSLLLLLSFFHKKFISNVNFYFFQHEHEHVTIRFLPLLPAKFTIFFNQIKSIET